MSETEKSGPAAVIKTAIAKALQLTVVRAYLRYSQQRGGMLADSVTYRTLFSLFAGVLLVFSVAALWLAGNDQAWQALINAINRSIPGLVGQDGLIQTTDIEAPAGLTVAGVIASVGLVMAAIGAIGSLRLAIRQIAGRIGDDIAFVWVLLRNLALAVGVGGALAASAVVTVLGTAGLDTVAGWLSLPDDSPLITVGSRILAIVVTFALDAAAIAVLFRVLSGITASARSLWLGSLIGAIGLTVLQQLSGLFVGGASSNQLLAAFASLIALLLWLNLSAQVILIASAIIVEKVEEEENRLRARHGAQTLSELRVRRAEDAVVAATDELHAARAADADARAGD